MIQHPSYALDPWCVRETELALDMLSQSESVFALSNGHIGLRGNLDEGEPFGLPGSYLNGVYELRPLPYAEAGYGYPEAGQTVINVTNAKLIRVLVDDEPFDVRYGELLSHQRVLDFRDGVLRREVLWRSPAGRTVKVSSTRMVSFTQRSIAAISFAVEPVDGSTHVVLQSELMANEAMPAVAGDPRVAAALESPLVSEFHASRDLSAALVNCTRRSGLRVAAAMDHVIDCPTAVETVSDDFEHVARMAATSVLEPGQTFRLIKLVAYGWSAQRSVTAMRDQVYAAMLAARQSGWDTLLAEQRAYLDDFWARADVTVEGDADVQQAVRFALFHILQAGARGERRPVPAKGLTGSGYDGHVFWDTETFVLPLLTYTSPEAAANALRWRQSVLPAAVERAKQLGLAGSAFPWRTIAGQECSAYWPAGTAAFHVNADIAHAVLRYIDATGDTEFERTTGVELLVETARLWRSLGHHDPAGRFRIDGVTGPDEYSALADNNVYTNLMAQRNLQGAADVAERHWDKARALGVTHEETAAWRDAASHIVVPYDEALGVHPQSENFTEHEVWDFEHTSPDQYPLLLHFPYFDLYRKQVIKQADLVLALHLRGDAFTSDEKARDFAYYEALTVRDSSLSASTQSIVAAEVGQLQLAMEYLREAALMDLDDLERNTRDGLHLASLAGTWSALVCGFGGLRDDQGMVTFAPRLPASITRLVFTITARGCRLRVEVEPATASYTLLQGETLDIAHHGTPITVKPGDATVLPIAPTPTPGKRPSQPPGRAPQRVDLGREEEGETRVIAPETGHTRQ
jgi:alpha,alpha-trehalose phosphorylase